MILCSQFGVHLVKHIFLGGREGETSNIMTIQLGTKHVRIVGTQLVTGFRHLIWYNLHEPNLVLIMCTKFGTWIVYQIWCKDSCTKFGTNFKDTLTYSYCLQSPIWVYHFCTKFGALYLYQIWYKFWYTSHILTTN